MNCKWGNKELLFTAGSFFVLISEATCLDQGYINITSFLHLLYNMRYISLILIIYGYSYDPIVSQGINWFSCLQTISALTTFTVNNIHWCGENCWEGKPFADREGMLGILPGGGITIFWFGVDIAFFVYGSPNTRKESSSSKPSKLNLPSCGNSVRIPRYSLI